MLTLHLAPLLFIYRYGSNDFARRLINLDPHGVIYIPYFLGHHAYKISHQLEFTRQQQRLLKPSAWLEALALAVGLFSALLEMELIRLPWSSFPANRLFFALAPAALISVIAFCSRKIAHHNTSKLLSEFESINLTAIEAIGAHIAIYRPTLLTRDLICRLGGFMTAVVAAVALLAVAALHTFTFSGWLTIFSLLMACAAASFFPTSGWLYYLHRHHVQPASGEPQSPTAPRRTYLVCWLLGLLSYGALAVTASMVGHAASSS